MYRYLVSNEKDALRLKDESEQKEVVGSYEEVVKAIRHSIIGEDITVAGSGLPLETRGRKMLYTDYTASGRGVAMVEDFMTNEVLPMYGNTHTVSSGTARQTTCFRQEARSIIKNYYKCSFEDALIFTGNGATGATATFINLLRRTKAFTNPSKIREEDRWGSIKCTACTTTFKNDKLFRAHVATKAHHDAVEQRVHLQHTATPYKGCMLLVDPMSHHSSILPYRELASEDPSFYCVETVAIDRKKGHLCTKDLAALLARCEEEKLKPVAAFAAASNVTGISVDTAAINTLVHEHGGVVMWDLAAVAGHMKVDMNPAPIGGKGDPSFDFAVVSPHKLLGGPGCVGLFFAKKKHLTNEVPCTVGGGIVHYVSPTSHSYIDNHEEREEAGTPNIVGCIKAGVVYRMHSMLDGNMLHRKETELLELLTGKLAHHPGIEILGSHCDARKVGILSFNILYDKNLYLHYNFATVLLNDLFGIQVRGGCACAGPYAQWLLGMNTEQVDWYDNILRTTGLEVLRPGFVRTGVHFTMTEEEVDTIAKAILWIADNGWKLLGAYTYHEESGEWEYANHQYDEGRKWISALTPATMLKRESIYARHPVMDIQKMLEEADNLVKVIYTPMHITLNKVVDDKLKGVDEWIFFATPGDFVYSVRKVLGDVKSVKDWTGIVPTTEHGRKTCWRVLTKVGVKRAHEEAPEEVVPVTPKAKKQKKNHVLHGVHIPKSLRALVGDAIRTYNMINAGDKILVGLSGGKDSMVLLHVLLAIQRVSPVKFEVGAATVNPMTPEYDPTPLIQYVRGLGVEFTMLSQPLIELAKEKMDARRPSICSFCSRMKRGMLYSHMRKGGYNVLALGQHADDIVESFLMSLFHNGVMTTMKANYVIQQGDIRVIRPLINVREKVTAQVAKENALPLIQDNCPACFAAPKERHRIKVLLSGQEAEHPNIFPIILKAIKPLIAVSETDRDPTRKPDEDDELIDQQAEESLQPCSSGTCPA
eukprot:TRINITY_DN4306_c0_g1_i1.p1 TRINITY_DN4306_c0_g1~~TRINITY_DN4306_c0_g1_i1.p1  ORF type:complete len:989 (+),score=351.71 TRINITY_DN4306_c0_g1_i1:42-3008(+)